MAGWWWAVCVAIPCHVVACGASERVQDASRVPGETPAYAAPAGSNEAIAPDADRPSEWGDEAGPMPTDQPIVDRSAASPPSTDEAPAEHDSRLSSIERTYVLPLASNDTARAMAARAANLYPAACRTELRRRHIPASPVNGYAVGVAAPMRITGSLRGVRFIAPGPKSLHGTLDCRLVLLLDELSTLLGEQGVAVVYVDGFYRPKAKLPGKKAPSQHSFGLAIDIHGFGLTDGRTLVVERDFGGRIGTPVCGGGAVLEPETENSIALRNIVCALARARAFHYLLTPNYDAAHRNHLHGDIKRGARDYVLR